MSKPASITSSPVVATSTFWYWTRKSIPTRAVKPRPRPTRRVFQQFIIHIAGSIRRQHRRDGQHRARPRRADHHHDEADAIGKIERIGIGHRIAEAIDHGKMRGVVALGAAEVEDLVIAPARRVELEHVGAHAAIDRVDEVWVPSEATKAGYEEAILLDDMPIIPIYFYVLHHVPPAPGREILRAGVHYVALPLRGCRQGDRGVPQALRGRSAVGRGAGGADE